MMQNRASPIETRLDAGVMVVQLNRPEKKNAVTLAMWNEIVELFQAFGSDASVRAVIITGAGGCFCAGADISEFPDVRGTPDQAARYEQVVDAALAAIASCPKPTIAAISGFCFAGGLAIAASADFRVSDLTAKYSVSAVRMGLVYNIPKCERLYQIVGLVNAKRFLLTGDRFDPEKARMLGFVDEICEGDVLYGARKLALPLIAGAPLALGGIKAILEALAKNTVEACRDQLQHNIRVADGSEDHREAVRAFAEKRPPAFHGR